MASISLTNSSGKGFYGYANGNTSYGYYNVKFHYSGISHSAGTLTLTGAYIEMSNPNSGYTTNTIYVDSVSVNGTNMGISGSANGGKSYHTWKTGSVDKSVSVAASATSCTVTMTGHRTGQSSGAQSLSGTLSFSAGSLWNDINAWNPAEDAQNGLIFDLRTSDGGSWSNLTNEPSGFTKTYGTTATISNIRTNITGAHYTKNNVTNTGASSFSWTFNTADWACNLYSAWNTYTIAYNANGGSGAPGSQTKTYGTNLTLSSTKPTRTGYTFLGWSTNSGATSASYSAGATLSSDLSTTNGATVTLYAVWSINSYYLDLNGWLDGASSGGLSPHGTANVTVNSSVVGSNVADYYAQHTYGSTYSISNIKANSGYQYNGVHSGSLSGTIGAGNVSVVLDFSTTKPSNLNINGSVNGPFEIGLSWSATGLNITNYTVYANGTQIYSGTNTTFTFNCSEETTYNIYFTATNVGGTTTSSTISLTTPADQAKIRIKKGLPAGYERLNYIEATGTQYIDTGITMKASTTIDCRFEVIDKVNDYLFGQEQNSRAMMYSGIYNANKYEYGWESYEFPTSDFIYMTQRIDGNTLITNINNSSFSMPINTTLPNYTTKIFQCNDNRYYAGRARVFFFVIKENGNPVIELYPCKRTSDSAIGMYDIVGNKFYPNLGTGTFGYGAITDWVKGKTYYKKDGRWVKAKKIYIKVNGQWKINNNYDN